MPTASDPLHLPDVNKKTIDAFSAYFDALAAGSFPQRPPCPDACEPALADLELCACYGLWPSTPAAPLVALRHDSQPGTLKPGRWYAVGAARYTTIGAKAEAGPELPAPPAGARIAVMTDRVDLDPAQLPTFARRPEFLVLISGPLYPAAHARLERLFGCPVRQAIPHPKGGWWAFSETETTSTTPWQADLGPRLRVWPGRALRLTDRFGTPLSAGQPGYLLDADQTLPNGNEPSAVSLADEPGRLRAAPQWLAHAFAPVNARQFADGNRLDAHEFSQILARAGAVAAEAEITSNRLDIALLRDPESPGLLDDAQLSAILRQRFEYVDVHPPVDGRLSTPFALLHAAPPACAYLWQVDRPDGEQTRAALREALDLLSRTNALHCIALENSSMTGGLMGQQALDAHLADVARELGLATAGEPQSPLLHRPRPDESGRFSVSIILWVDWIPCHSGGLLLLGDNEAATKMLRGALYDHDAPVPRRLRVFGIAPRSQQRLRAIRPRTITPDIAPVQAPAGVCESAVSGACTRCLKTCPRHCIAITDSGQVRLDGPACIGCMRCVEVCPTGDFAPVLSDQTVVQGDVLTRLWPRLAELIDGEIWPTPLPLADEREREWTRQVQALATSPFTRRKKPLVVLGLAMMTMMEHAAALLVDGKLVAAVEEERLNRVKHFHFNDPGFPLASLASDPALPAFAPMPQRAIQTVLTQAGLNLADVDLIAVNGFPYRLRDALGPLAHAKFPAPLEALRSDRLVWVPHHLAHAAACAALAGWNDDATILTVDGRGDRETAVLFNVNGGRFERVAEWPFAPDRSIGGVYETVTRALGFGSHGQGQTMALAALGRDNVNTDAFFTLDETQDVVSEWAASFAASAQITAPGEPPDDAMCDLAASIQDRLEQRIEFMLRRHGVKDGLPRLGLSGGVALNCRMNGRIRRRFNPGEMFVPAAAHDAGTAIGAAAIAHQQITGDFPDLSLGHTNLGPKASDEAIAAWLSAKKIHVSRPKRLAQEVAERLAEGQIVGWVQEGLEFGPRALGGRSILADPRRESLKARLNRIKSRQSWRPFGVSVLAGRQAEWFEDDWDSRYMLFAVRVRPERASAIPVGMHLDGTTRPQIVHAALHPRYHDLIASFEDLTGVPMLVNTSFNRGGEPIVHTPAEAVADFIHMELDALVLGDCLIVRDKLKAR
jgi:carbamoyltransferase